MTVDEYLGKINIDKILYINKIPLEKVLRGPVQVINPLSIKYKLYWREEERRIYDGFWVSHEGLHKWVPGAMYFYGKYWSIKLNDDKSDIKGKVIGRPKIRDVEWIKFYLYYEMRGFSGFELDDEYSAHRSLEGLNPNESEEDVLELKFRLSNLGAKDRAYLSLINSSGKYKKYKAAEEMLWEYQTEPLGRILMFNEALNLADIESRGVGKSYTMSGLAGYTFITSGVTSYEAAKLAHSQGKPPTAEQLIGAIDSKYSGDTISKFRLGMEEMVGSQSVGSLTYPSPFSRLTAGSLDCGNGKNPFRHEYKVKEGGSWTFKGSKSNIQHRSFDANIFAGNGNRYIFGILDEIGLMYNLLGALGQLGECMVSGGEKFGSMWMTGTGGDMDGGASLAIYSVYYDPRAWACVARKDNYGETDKEIGLFIPAWMGLNQYKDELGNTDYKAAIYYILRAREVKAKANNKKAYNDELTQRPIFPGEAFLVAGGSIMPVADLRAQLGYVNASLDGEIKGQIGELITTAEGKINFVPDTSGKLQVCGYPVKPDADNTGAVQIWEHPTPEAGYGMYLGGIDPYDQDKAATSVSLGSIFIMKRQCIGGSGYDQIVAEYTARPPLARDFYETCRRLLVYYNMYGTCLYENEKMNIKSYFESHNSLQYLAPTPTVLKANVDSKVNRQLGQHMNKNVKEEAEIYLRDWLLTDAGDGVKNLHRIYSVGLLTELSTYNATGNFDRVIAMMLCIIQKQQMHRIVMEKKEDITRIDSFFTRKMF